MVPFAENQEGYNKQTKNIKHVNVRQHSSNSEMGGGEDLPAFGVRAGFLLLVLAGSLAGCSVPSQPRVQPQDVMLKADVKPGAALACAPDARWMLEVELNRSTNLPLYAGEREYMYAVHVFDGQHPLSPDDYGEGCEDNKVDFGAAHIALVNDGRIYAHAVQTARDSGDLPTTFSDTKSEGAGFTYTGRDFPVKIRYYFSDTEPPTRKFAVVYVHYENRRGQDLSWTKTVYAESGTKR